MSVVQTLVDRVAVEDIVAVLGLAPDSGDWAAYSRCFDDHVDVTNPHFMAAPTRFTAQQWADRVASNQGDLSCRFHLLSTAQITINGDSAQIVVQQQVRFVRSDDSTERVYEVGGPLRLGLTRRPAGWRITQLDYTVTWHDGDQDILNPMGSVSR